MAILDFYDHILGTYNLLQSRDTILMSIYMFWETWNAIKASSWMYWLMKYLQQIVCKKNLEDMKDSHDLFNNVKIGQGQLKVIIY